MIQFTTSITQSSLISTTEALYLDLIDSNDNIIEYTELNECDDIYFGSHIIPTVPARYQLRGQDIFGVPFTHVISNSAIEVRRADINVELLANSEIIVNPNITSAIKFSVINNQDGPAMQIANISITCLDFLTASVENTDRQMLMLLPHQMEDIIFDLYGSADLVVGTSANCTVEVTEMICGDSDDTESSESFVFQVQIIAGIEVDVTSITESTVELEWITPDGIEGDILNYTVTIDFDNGTSIQTVIDADIQSLTLTGLLPYQTIYFTISAEYNNGEEARIHPIIIVTDEAGNIHHPLCNRVACNNCNTVVTKLLHDCFSFITTGCM